MENSQKPSALENLYEPHGFAKLNGVSGETLNLIN